MDAFFGKKYKLTSSENFDEMMKALDVGLITRKAGAAVSPTVELVKTDDDNYRLKTSSTFKSTDIEFSVGKEFDETTVDGRKVKSVVTFDGTTMTHTQTPPDNAGKKTTIIREFSPSEMKAIMTVSDLGNPSATPVVCTRIYTAQ